MTSSQPVTTPNALIFTPDNLRCYAFSGTFQASVSTQTMLDFTTNSEYLVGQLFMSGGVSYASGNLGDGQHTGYRIKINGVIVSIVKLSSITEAMETTATQPLIIPPNSQVTVEILSSGDSATQLGTCSFSGQAVGMTTTGYQ